MTRDAGTAAGEAVEELREIEACKKQTTIIKYACLCAATTLASKIIAEIMKKHSEFCGGQTAAINLCQVDIYKPYNYL